MRSIAFITLHAWLQHSKEAFVCYGWMKVALHAQEMGYVGFLVGTFRRLEGVGGRIYL